ncbi:hypothetical protein [Nonomuraea sp. CA-141351]
MVNGGLDVAFWTAEKPVRGYPHVKAAFIPMAIASLGVRRPSS